MKLTSEQLKIVESLIESYDETEFVPKKIVEKFNFLPIWIDWLVLYALTLDGKIVVSNEEWSQFTKEANQLRINIALFKGITRFPELSFLMPVKNNNDSVCSYCEGTGKHPDVGTVSILCYCGGLGWIPENHHFHM